MTDEVAPVVPSPAPAPAPAAPITPTPAPAAPVVPAVEDKTSPPGPVTPVEKTNDGKTVTFQPTGDSGLDLSLKYFGGLGLSLASPELAEASKGNFAYLEAKMSSLPADKADEGKQYLQIAKDAYTRLEASNQAAYTERKAVVHAEVGGEENWNKIVEFVKANAEPEEQKQVTDALSKGGVMAKAMAKYLAGLYAAGSGNTVLPKDATKNQPTAGTGGAPLTLSGYKSELAALQAKIGSHRLDASPEYQALRKRYANVRA